MPRPFRRVRTRLALWLGPDLLLTQRLEVRRAALEEARQIVLAEVIRIELCDAFMPPNNDTSKWQVHALEQAAAAILYRAEHG